MKIRSFQSLLSLLLLFFLISSCSLDHPEGPKDEPENLAIVNVFEPFDDPKIHSLLEEYYQIEIEQLHIWENKIFLDKDSYVYEEDLESLHKELDERKNPLSTRQWRYPSYPSGRNGTMVTLRYNSALSALEVQALKEAIRILNRVSNFGLSFRCTSRTPDISVGRTYELGCTAAANRPTSSRFGNYIGVGPDAQNLGLRYLCATFVHEIMHTIGFAHPGEYNHIPGTPTLDTRSIMYPCNCQQCNDMGLYNLSGNDKTALRILYPG